MCLVHVTFPLRYINPTTCVRRPGTVAGTRDVRLSDTGLCVPERTVSEGKTEADDDNSVLEMQLWTMLKYRFYF